jgi:hypothetical protein
MLPSPRPRSWVIKANPSFIDKLDAGGSAGSDGIKWRFI